MISDLKELIAETKGLYLVAVTKTRSIPEIKKAVELGVKIIGENRIQEALAKYQVLKSFLVEHNVQFHFIGHLQTNKVRHAVQMFDLIQTVDSVKLAQEIDKRAQQNNKIQNILLQVNIGQEKQKYGFLPKELTHSVDQVKILSYLNIKGFMCMAPHSSDPEKTRQYFREMKKLSVTYNYEILSMGMSNDYRIAITEGSNMIRLGTKIFGKS